MDTIVIHCSATPQGQQVTVYDIDRGHGLRGFKRRTEAVKLFNPGLPHIGYHFLIDLKGEIFTGRALEEIGAHVSGSNARSIGVCMVGMRRFTAGQWTALRELVQTLQGAYPQSRVVGHRDLSPDLDGDGVVEPQEWLKECPTFDVKSWLLGGMQPLAQHLVGN
ncbi:MAG: N-acetylmuramoyl-L-alanine amidase [Hylemonella sp.]|uniref:N-acetylmuramoyl-L-alanine amidase n=1 Tax=Hylemonella sp. TaxID=2066020 RepID=UPI00391AC4A8